MASKNKKVESVPPPAPEVEETEALAAEVADPNTSLSTEVVDEWDYGEDANKGFKNLSRDEFSIPFYGLLQSNSEIVKQNKIEGARGGMFINTLTGQLFTKLIVQPIFVERVFVEWAPRNSGKGILGRHKFESAEVFDAIAANGGSSISTKEKPLKLGENFLVDTRYLYFQILEEDGLTVKGFGIMPFSKTKIKPLVNATSAILQAGLKSPTWGGRFVLTSQVETKNGETFHNVVIKAFGKDALHFDKTNLLPPAPPDRHPSQLSPKQALYLSGKELEASIVGGQHKADFEREAAASQAEGEGESIDSPGAGKRHF